MLSISKKVLSGRISRVASRKDVFVMQIRGGCELVDIVAVAMKTLMPKAEQWASVSFDGEMEFDPLGKNQEFKVTGIRFYGEFKGEDIKIGYDTSIQTIRQEISQRLLTKTYQLMMRVRASLMLIIHLVSRDLGLMQITAPIITFSDCEGGGETFEVKSAIKGFFKKSALRFLSS